MNHRNGGRGRPDEENVEPSHSERTPLLKANGVVAPAHENGSAVHAAGVVPHGQEEEQTVLAEEVSFTKLALIMGTAWVGVFLGAIDSTIIATLAAPIASEFRSLNLYSWLATAYLISNAACQPISGRLTDIFGRGPGLVVSNLFFAAGNLICGLAQDEGTMILGRVVAGIGGGGLMSISTFLGSDLIPLRKRGVVQGIGNLCYGSGAMLGGIFGGLINDHTSMGWRLAFLIQVPPVLVSAVAVAILVRVPPKQSDKSYLSRIDFGGVFLTSSFLVLLLLGLNSGGNQVPWMHPLILTTIPLSIVTFLGFLWWESKARQPIIPVRLLAERTVLAACFCNLLATMVVIAGLFYVPLYLQVLGFSSTDAGLKILPSPVGVSICSIGAGYLMKRTGRYVGLGITSILMVILGIVCFTLQGRDSPGWLTGVAFFFVGGGYGAMLTITLLACIAAVDHSQQAVITSATCKRPPVPDQNLARSLGGTLGVTIASAVYQNILKTQLWARFGDQPNAADEIQRIRDSLDELKSLPDGWYDGVIDSFMEAFRAVWLTLLGMAVLALACISLMRQHTLHSTLERR
ncbi:Protein SGT1 A [Purpureocillium lavendulum]|uniref:Protein SGT1 A n=1 Tax=Purpureocillium lavendulum TaxID=1247861 RepID=A0AB34FI46_9HYPO|nr:Protein SGT1 A [Purpureocillium lavendulum]